MPTNQLNDEQDKVRQAIAATMTDRQWGEYCDNPARFDDLNAAQREDVLDWIDAVFTARKTPNRNRTSYGYKHDYAGYRNRTAQTNELGDHYLLNGAFKGAMLCAGFEPVDRTAQNWTFCVTYRPIKEG